MFAKRTQWDLTPNAFSQALERLRTSGRKVLDLTASNPTVVGLDYEREKIVRALHHPEALHYQPEAKGLRVAREAVARYYAELPQPVTVDPERIILTASTSEAYTYCFRLLCDPGDEVLVPRPSYPLFELLAGIQDVKLAPYPLFYDHGWHMDVSALGEAVTSRTRAVIVVHPNNPTGSYVQVSERGALNETCKEHDLTLVADEVFMDFPHGQPQASFAGDQDVLTFTLSGLSKIAGLPQMKVAWMAVSGPAGLRNESMSRLDVIADTYLSPNAPLQWATPELLQTRHAFQHSLLARLRHNLAELDRRLSQQSLCSRLHVEAGWYATLRTPAIRSDEELAVRLMEKEGVVVHPGHFFDFTQEGHLVLSLLTPPEDFTEGLRRILSAVGDSS
ncbi:MAG: pyridoxal phosphate-dependent aminotransferase [Acidobacteriales bacterium]|nr:pyridoxal phosphate-dependent aminotransferase [Terriglobales bacterium]